MSGILQVKHLTKTFKSSDHVLTVLKDIHFSVDAGQGISIVGPSGSGKTTLLGLCAGLDQPTDGTITLMEIELNRLDEDDRAYVRNLLPTINALENVMIPLELRGEKNIRSRAEDMLSRVGLSERMKHYPSQLSGGEQQRVAIARAFVSNPKILFADEPTGNLDEETADIVSKLLFQMNREENTTLVLVTHNIKLAEHTGRILKLEGGLLMEDKII
jgi:putative ABC transport system ATP-binding protein